MSHAYIVASDAIFTSNSDKKLPWGQRVHWPLTSGSAAGNILEFIFSGLWLNYYHIDMSQAYIVVITPIFT